MVKKTKNKVFDTDTATVIKKVTSGFWGDPAGYETTLFQTPEGDYFLYVNGGEASPYPKEGIKSLAQKAAKQWLEEN